MIGKERRGLEVWLFFFSKQKTAYEIRLSHGGSEMCKETARGFSRSELVLRMTREEIGSYLGLKLETVSRTFSRLQDDGVLEVKQRQIRIVDQNALRQIVNASTC